MNTETSASSWPTRQDAPSPSDPNNKKLPTQDDMRIALVLARKALIRWDNLALVDEAMARIDFALGYKQ